ncbi:MAG: tetratricopeptide repeat protein [Bacteroidaceae bacterium]|nr:tetratricopeptide repeat protein [Bacteroidaceae bacterium]
MNNDKGFYESPEFRELLAKYEKSIKLGMGIYLGIDEFADLLSYYLSIDRPDDAANVLDAAKRLHPTAPELVKMEIRILLYNGEATQALERFGDLKYIDEAEKLTIKAEIMLALRDFKQARDIAIALLSMKTPDQGYVYEGLEILLDCGFALEALEICERALKMAPGQTNLKEVKAECLIELQRISEAVKIYNELLDENPYSTFYWEQLGHIYYMVKKFGKSLECFEYESAINEEIEYASMMQAYCYYFLQDYKKAKELFGALARKYSNTVMPIFYIGLCHYHERAMEEALNAFDIAINCAQEGTISMMLARVNKAILLDLQGETSVADDAMSMALLMHPDNMKQLVLTNKHLYELRDRENLTFDDMNIIETKEWSTEETLYRLGEHLVRHNHLALGKRVFRYCRDISYDKADVDAFLAYILWNTDKKGEVASYIESALDGRSNKLFELFDIPYNANISTTAFIEQVNEKESNA